MPRISAMFVCALSVLAQDGLSPAFHQQTPFGAPGPVGKQPGFFRIDRVDSPMLYFNAVAEPPLDNSSELKLAWLVNKTQNVWHRFVIDRLHRQYFGYDVSATPADQGAFRITFGPPSTAPGVDGLMFLGVTTTLFSMSLPRFPDPLLAKPGEMIALDLLVSPDEKQKIVDYIQVSSTSRTDLPAAISTVEPKDFTLDDGPLKIDFAGFVSMNGQKFQGMTWFDKKPGATLWFSFPGRGRYILSLAPHDGFLKLGTIRDDAIQFESDGQRYEIRMKSPLVESGGAWNLYVLHDPSYQAEPSSQQMILLGAMSAGTTAIFGGTDRLENLLPK